MRPDSWKGEVWVKNNGMKWNMYFHESDDKMGSHIRKCSKHFLEVRTCTEEESRHQGHHLCRASQRKCALIRTKQTHMNCNYLFWACSPLIPSHPPIYLQTTCSLIFDHWPAHLPTCLLSVYPSTYPHTYPSIHPPTYSSIHPSIHPCIYLSLSIIHSCVHPPTHTPIHPFTHPLTHPTS